MPSTSSRPKMPWPRTLSSFGCSRVCRYRKPPRHSVSLAQPPFADGVMLERGCELSWGMAPEHIRPAIFLEFCGTASPPISHCKVSLLRTKRSFAMAIDPAKVRSIFIQAIECHSPEEWNGYLEMACGGDL